MPWEEYTRIDIHTTGHGRSYVGSSACFLEACLYELPHLGAGEECEEEEAAERSCYGQTVTPYSLSSCASWGRGKVDYLEWKTEVVPWKRERWRERDFWFHLCFSPVYFQMVINQINFHISSMFCFWGQFLNDIPVFISIQQLFHLIFS